jgi:hypothetical protein
MEAATGDKKPCFINMSLTVQDIDTPGQQFTLKGYVNALWRCPDLEKEEERSDYYSPSSNPELSVKAGLARAASDSAFVYVRDSKTDTAGTLKYVTGFDLSVESDVLPFSPQRIFDIKRIRSFVLSTCDYYYYPMEHNRGKTCAGLLKMACGFEVTLVQHWNMHNFPFDRQLLHLNVRIRHSNWIVHHEAPDWVNTGYLSDRTACRISLSEAILNYTLEAPWVDNRPGSFNGEGPSSGHHVYIRIERRYGYELQKIVLPLFFIVLFAMSSFGLEPDETSDRVGAPTGMMLAVIGFQYVIQETVPKQPQVTRLDTYIFWCMAIIIMIVAQSLAQKQLLESTLMQNVTVQYGELEIADVDRNGLWYARAEWIDTCCALLCFLVWVVPHAVIYWYIDDLEALPCKLGTKILKPWEDSLHFLERDCAVGEAKPGELMERGGLRIHHTVSLQRWTRSAKSRVAETQLDEGLVSAPRG